MRKGNKHSFEWSAASILRQQVKTSSQVLGKSWRVKVSGTWSVILYCSCVSENLMPENGALPNVGIGVSLQNSFNARSIRVGTSNNASDSST